MLVKLEWLGYRTVKKNCHDILSRFHLMLTRDKNHRIVIKFCTQQQILNRMNVTWSHTKRFHCINSEFDRTYFLCSMKWDIFAIFLQQTDQIPDQRRRVKRLPDKSAVWAQITCVPDRQTRGQSNLTKSASRGAHSPVRGHPRGSKFVPLNSWGRGSY